MIESLLCKMAHNTIPEKTASNEITITTATAATKLFRWVNIFILKVTVQKTPSILS